MGTMKPITPLIPAMGLQIAGLPGLMSQGKSIFVKPYSGSDNYHGLRPDRAVKTLSKALSLATANQNDVVYMFAESNTAANTTDYQSALLDWNKDLVHLIGVGPPSMVSQRCRIANKAGANLAGVFKVSANGCIISNVQVINGDNNAAALLAATVSGARNFFHNVHFAGIAGGTTQSAAAAADLKLDGASENVFRHCVIGLDTVARDADPSGGISCANVATRNLFEDCLIQAYISAAGYPHVKLADATSIDRWLWFNRCMFVAKSDNKATGQTSVFSIPAITQGAIILQDSYAFSDGGAVDWDSNNRGIIWNNSVAAAAGAAGGIMTNQ